MTKTITINGTPQLVEPPFDLVELLASHEIRAESARGVAVAINEKIVRRSEWANTTLLGGERIEIVTARQGG